MTTKVVKIDVAFVRPAPLAVLAIAGLLAMDASFALARRQSSTDPGTGKWNYAALAKVPDEARSKPNPLENSAGAAAGGGKLFEQHCAECHGRRAEGGKYAPSLLRKEVQEATPGALFWIVTNGVVRRGMPVWSKLPEPERWQVVLYLQTLTHLPSSAGTSGRRQ